MNFAQRLSKSFTMLRILKTSAFGLPDVLPIISAYRDSDQVLCPETFHSYTRPELEVFRQILKKTISVVEIRGLDT